MISFTIKTNKTLVGRNAIQLVHSFTPIKSAIYVSKGDRKVNAKSILGLLSAEIEEGDILCFDVINDEDAKEVDMVLQKYFLDEE